MPNSDDLHDHDMQKIIMPKSNPWCPASVRRIRPHTGASWSILGVEAIRVAELMLVNLRKLPHETLTSTAPEPLGGGVREASSPVPVMFRDAVRVATPIRQAS